jgi:hypothetical protein
MAWKMNPLQQSGQVPKAPNPADLCEKACGGGGGGEEDNILKAIKGCLTGECKAKCFIPPGKICLQCIGDCLAKRGIKGLTKAVCDKMACCASMILCDYYGNPCKMDQSDEMNKFCCCAQKYISCLCYTEPKKWYHECMAKVFDKCMIGLA